MYPLFPTVFLYSNCLSNRLIQTHRAVIITFVQLEPNYSADHEFQLTTRRLTNQITDGVTANAALKEITFDRFSAVQRERQSLFWQLPSKFTGNQVCILISH